MITIEDMKLTLTARTARLALAEKHIDEANLDYDTLCTQLGDALDIEEYTGRHIVEHVAGVNADLTAAMKVVDAVKVWKKANWPDGIDEAWKDVGEALAEYDKVKS